MSDYQELEFPTFGSSGEMATSDQPAEGSSSPLHQQSHLSLGALPPVPEHVIFEGRNHYMFVPPANDALDEAEENSWVGTVPEEMRMEEEENAETMEAGKGPYDHWISEAIESQSSSDFQDLLSFCDSNSGQDDAEGRDFLMEVESQQTNLPTSEEDGPSQPTSLESTEEPEKSGKKKTFQLDTSLIPQASLGEQAPELSHLGLNVIDQEDFEQGVKDSVEKLIEESEARQRQEVFSKEMDGIDEDIREAELELGRLKGIRKDMAAKNFQGSRDALNTLKSVTHKEEKKKEQLKRLHARKKALIAKWTAAERGEGDGPMVHRKETDQERLIRMGEMTPFGTMMPRAHTASSSTRPSQSHTSTSKSSQPRPGTSKSSQPKPSTSRSSQPRPSTSQSSQPQLSTPPVTAFDRYLLEAEKSREKPRHKHHAAGRKKKEKDVMLKDQINAARMRMQHRHDQLLGKSTNTQAQVAEARQERRHKFRRLESGSSRDGLASDEEEDDKDDGSDEEYVPSKEEWRSSRREDGHVNKVSRKRKRGPGRPKAAQARRSSSEEERPKEGLVKRDRSIRKETDDADDDAYNKRLRALQRMEAIEDGVDGSSDEESSAEFRVPKKLMKKLYPYQRTCVQWLWELHAGGAGGIIGDEMGLGKTIQVIVFLAALRRSRFVDTQVNNFQGLGPVIIVCPATVMDQWVKEFHTWAPEFRVSKLHSSGSYSSETELLRTTTRSRGVVVTSYNTLVKHQELLLRFNWHYIILDEGHKIRNPDAQCTLVCKSFKTPHRLILSGSPIQNNLKELWSLFDFINPGLLGTLSIFQEEFAVPIAQGGHTNSSLLQVETACRCARHLRDTMNPYLLRRMKADVKEVINLPKKTEQILFCKLTEQQEEVYMEYLASRECKAILQRRANAFAGLQKMRDICNHPDMCTGGPKEWDDADGKSDEEKNYGYWGRSGKLIVVNSLLPMWKSQNHRVLLFSQSKRMLNIIQAFLQERKYSYLRMDGDTPVSSRQPLVSQFNKDPSIFVFLLSTKVGGLGVNLTGANRIIIFDPDWNPVTDLQARERAWRIGQERQVTIYRLLTTGTVEEKIYHKQVYKSCLANRVLKDPKQPAMLPTNDLFDYFSIASYSKKEGTLSSALFAGTGAEINIRKLLKRYNRFDAQQMHKDPKVVLKERQKVIRRRTGVREDNKPSPPRSEDAKETKDAAKQTDLSLPSCAELPATVEERRALARRLSHQIELKKREREKAASAGSSSEGQSAVEQKKSEAESSRRSSSEQKHKSEGENGTKRRPHDSHTDRQESSGKRHRGEGSSSEHRHLDTDRRDSVMHRHQQSKDRSSAKHHHSSLQRQGSKDSQEGKHQSKKSKDAKCEGQRIPFLAKKKVYKIADETEETNSMSQDDYVLTMLMKNTGLQGVLRHDKIVNGRYTDHHLTQVEAEKMAKAAAAALKRSRAQCHSAVSGNPNNFGHNGAGLPKQKFGRKSNIRVVEAESTRPVPAVPTKADQAKEEAPKKLYERKEKKKEKQFGEALFDGSKAGFTSLVETNLMTSDEVVVHIQKRKLLAGEESGDLDEDSTLASGRRQIVNPEDMELFTDLRNFISVESRVNGEASMKEIWNHFGPRTDRGHQHKIVPMLKEICDEVKVNDKTVWKLKHDMR